MLKKDKELLDRLETKATDSTESWELFEHKIWNAYEHFVLPEKLHLSKKAIFFSDSGPSMAIARDLRAVRSVDYPIEIYVNLNSISVQLENITEGECKERKVSLYPIFSMYLSPYQVLYMTPPTRPVAPILDLSYILDLLPSMHILFLKTKESFKFHKCFIGDYDSLIMVRPDIYKAGTQLYDLKIPDDSNILLGTCRDIDDSF